MAMRQIQTEKSERCWMTKNERRKESVPQPETVLFDVRQKRGFLRFTCEFVLSFSPRLQRIGNDFGEILCSSRTHYTVPVSDMDDGILCFVFAFVC